MAILESIKGIANVVKEIGDIDLNRKVIDLQGEVFELLEENYKLKSEIQELTSVSDMQDKLLFKNNTYYLIDDDNENGPYCSSCWDENKNLIRLHDTDFGYLCPVCMRKK